MVIKIRFQDEAGVKVKGDPGGVTARPPAAGRTTAVDEPAVLGPVGERGCNRETIGEGVCLPWRPWVRAERQTSEEAMTREQGQDQIARREEQEGRARGAIDAAAAAR